MRSLSLGIVVFLFPAVFAGEGPANDQDWAFQPISRVTPPKVTNEKWLQSPIDAFILRQLERRGLQPTHAADRRTLIRRATFDLIGLPPTPQEIDDFVADRSPDAFRKVIDRLLDSPHYGERWGRHWLDVVRYADTAGDNSDYPVPQLYRYRNYVIDSFNSDKPYDLFLLEQIAGDLMPAEDEAQRKERIIATGYIAISRRFGSQIKNYPQHLTIEDTIDNLGRAVLGLTINCARCHDHKFDPLSREDYYGLYGIFNSTRYPFPGIELLKVQKDFVPLVPQEEVDALMRPYQEKMAKLDAGLEQLRAETKATEKRIRATEKRRRAETTDDERRQELEEEIAAARRRLREQKKALQRAERDRAKKAKDKPQFESAYAVAEAEAANVKVHIQGDPKRLGEEVPRGFLEVLGAQKLPKECRASGRLELGRWLTDRKNPLTPRVMVNRIWQHHFGKGIVQTPNNFGSLGRRPTHPELLDYLAERFIQRGWSIKAMHRLIMLSATYRLDSRGQDENLALDPNNDWRWRFNRRRLDAEEIRDALLAVSGALDRTRMDEPHPFPDPRKWGFTQHTPFKAVYESNRRSVYLMTQRLKKHPFLETFDGPDPNASTGQRRMTTTPIQALFMMNDRFFHEQAAKFAARLMAERAGDSERIELASQLALGRPPTDEERQASDEYVASLHENFHRTEVPLEQHDRLAWESYARAVLRLNEFIYVD